MLPAVSRSKDSRQFGSTASVNAVMRSASGGNRHLRRLRCRLRHDGLLLRREPLLQRVELMLGPPPAASPTWRWICCSDKPSSSKPISVSASHGTAANCFIPASACAARDKCIGDRHFVSIDAHSAGTCFSRFKIAKARIMERRNAGAQSSVAPSAAATNDSRDATYDSALVGSPYPSHQDQTADLRLPGEHLRDLLQHVDMRLRARGLEMLH
jgi:hypothetical protein